MPPSEKERILTLELNLKNFMERVEEKFDTIIEKLNEMPKIYATKTELQWVKEELAMGNARKVARIQQYGWIVWSLVWLLGVILALIIK